MACRSGVYAPNARLLSLEWSARTQTCMIPSAISIPDTSGLTIRSSALLADLTFSTFFAMVILLLLLVDKRHKPCSVREDSFIRPLTADLRFSGHGAILFVGLKASKITCLLFMPTAKITKNVSAAADGGNVPYSTLISIKTKV